MKSQIAKEVPSIDALVASSDTLTFADSPFSGEEAWELVVLGVWGVSVSPKDSSANAQQGSNAVIKTSISMNKQVACVMHRFAFMGDPHLKR